MKEKGATNFPIPSWKKKRKENKPAERGTDFLRGRGRPNIIEGLSWGKLYCFFADGGKAKNSEKKKFNA